MITTGPILGMFNQYTVFIHSLEPFYQQTVPRKDL